MAGTAATPPQPPAMPRWGIAIPNVAAPACGSRGAADTCGGPELRRLPLAVTASKFIAEHIGMTTPRSRAMTQLAEKREAKSVQIKDASFRWYDPLDLDGELTEEERMVRDTARDYAQEKLFPRVLNAYRNEQYDPAIVREMGALGLLGATIPEQYGGAGLGYTAYALIAREVERVDSGYRSAMSV